MSARAPVFFVFAPLFVSESRDIHCNSTLPCGLCGGRLPSCRSSCYDCFCLSRRRPQVFSGKSLRLICHGPTSAKVHEEYVEWLEKRYRSRIKAFSVRYKEKGWTPPYLRAEFENGQVFMKPFYETEYGMAFAVMARESCYRCPFKGENRRGDIMIGDFWGASESDPFGTATAFR